MNESYENYEVVGDPIEDWDGASGSKSAKPVDDGFRADVDLSYEPSTSRQGIDSQQDSWDPRGMSSDGRPPYADSEAQTFAMLCHFGAYAMFFVPLGHIVVPLIVWLVKKDQYAFVEDQGREALNFQLTQTLLFLLILPFCILLVGIPFLFVQMITWLIWTLKGGLAASRGQHYRYPLTIRFLY